VAFFLAILPKAGVDFFAVFFGAVFLAVAFLDCC
jgi:hypothetical protein